MAHFLKWQLKKNRKIVISLLYLLSYIMLNKIVETCSVLVLSFRTRSLHEWYFSHEFLGVSVDAAAV